MTRPKRRKKSYSDEEKAAALAVLAANAGSTRAAARQLAAAGVRVPEATLRDWAAQPMQLEPAVVEMVEDAKRRLDEILEGVAGKLARGLDRPEAIARIMSRPVQAATVLGILIDKMKILRGEATQVVEHVSYTEPGTLRALSLRVLDGGKQAGEDSPPAALPARTAKEA